MFLVAGRVKTRVTLLRKATIQDVRDRGGVDDELSNVQEPADSRSPGFMFKGEWLAQQGFYDWRKGEDNELR